MGVGIGRAGRTEEPMGARGMGYTGCRPMGWQPGALPLSCGRQVAASRGAGKEPVRVRTPEAGGRPGEPRRHREPPECEVGPGSNSDGRARTGPPVGAAPHLHPPHGMVGGLRGERGEQRDWEWAARLGGSGRWMSQSRGGGVPMAAGCRVCVWAP